MKYEVVKLDGRFSYSKIYRYCIEFSSNRLLGTGVLDFDRARRWFNRTYGWSQDVKTQNKIARELNSMVPASHEPDDINSHWAYSTEYRNYRIYVSSDRELMMFELTHAGT